MSVYCCHCLSELKDGVMMCPNCGKVQLDETPAHHISVGTVLKDKYVVGKAIGEGGFGITYVGKDLVLNIKVAIKEFFPNGYVNRNNTVSMAVYGSATEERKNVFDSGKERFLNEARILAKFSKEPGIVDVKDFFEANNTAYIVMEYLEGQTLKQLLSQRGCFSPDEIWQMFVPIMLSLKEIHKHSLIHRDISPDNIMYVDNRLKLLDFGAARNVSAAANKSLSVMLKPGYAPEEQYRSKGNQGAWTDIYALSATLYKCITGITPDDSTERIIDDNLKSPSALGILIDPNYEKALMKGLGVLQKDRFQSIDELIGAVEGRLAQGGTKSDSESVITVAPHQLDNDKTVYAEDGVTVLGDEESIATIYADESETVYADEATKKPNIKQPSKLETTNNSSAHESVDTSTSTVSKKPKSKVKFVADSRTGRLSKGQADMNIEFRCAKQSQLASIRLNGLDNKEYEFYLEERISYCETDYIIVSQISVEGERIFFFYKDPPGTANPPTYIPTGKKLIKVYRIFIATHKDIYDFIDEENVKPKIQEPKKPKRKKPKPEMDVKIQSVDNSYKDKTSIQNSEPSDIENSLPAKKRFAKVRECIEITITILGIIVALGTVIFGVYAWFAEIGLGWIEYYMILIGGSLIAVLMSLSDGGVKETLKCMAIFGPGIPILTTIISLIGELIVWIINLF